MIIRPGIFQEMSLERRKNGVELNFDGSRSKQKWGLQNGRESKYRMERIVA